MAGEWEQTTLAAIARITSGKRPPRIAKEQTEDCSVPVVGGGGPSGYTDRALFVGDILITGRVGTLGKLICSSGPCWPSDNALVIQPKDSDTDGRFLRYALLQVIDQAAGMNRGAANPLITQSDLGRLETVLPPLPEQRAIAQILGTLDDKIEVNRRMNGTLEGMARALFQSWFVDFDPVRAKAEGRDPGLPKNIAELFPDGFEDSELGEIPRGWGVGRLSDILSESNERIGDINAPEYSSTNSGLQLRSERFQKTLAASSAKNKLIRKGFLVFGLSRQVLNFGLMRDEIGSVSSAYKVFRVREEVLHADLLERLMRLQANRFYMAVAASSREGQSISAEGLGLLRLVLPPRNVQQAFYSFDDGFGARDRAIELESRTLAALRDALLPKLISGELRVGDAARFVGAGG